MQHESLPLFQATLEHIPSLQSLQMLSDVSQDERLKHMTLEYDLQHGPSRMI